MTDKHTPLPFGITTSNTKHDDEISLFGENGDCYIGTIQGDVGLQENQENAHFIVKACNCHYELLEALEGTLALAGTDSPLWDQARDAIFKAKSQGIYTKEQYKEMYHWKF